MWLDHLNRLIKLLICSKNSTLKMKTERTSDLTGWTKTCGNLSLRSSFYPTSMMLWPTIQKIQIIRIELWSCENQLAQRSTGNLKRCFDIQYKRCWFILTVKKPVRVWWILYRIWLNSLWSPYKITVMTLISSMVSQINRLKATAVLTVSQFCFT